MSYMDRNQIINESFFKIFEEDNHGTLDEGYWDLFKKFLRGDKQYMKQVKDINKTMSSLEKKLQKRLDNVSKQTGKKFTSTRNVLGLLNSQHNKKTLTDTLG